MPDAAESSHPGNVPSTPFLPAMREGQSLTMQAMWMMAAKTLAFAFNFALPLLLVRQLTMSEFGLYKQVFLIVNAAIMMLPLGFAMNAFYFWPRVPGRRDALVLNILLFYLLVTGLAGLGLIGWPELLANVFHGPELVAHGKSIGLVVLLWGVSSYLDIVAIANGETRLAAVLIVTLQLTKAMVLLAAALWSASVGGLIEAAAIHGVLQVGVLLAYLGSRFGRFWRRFDGALLRAQLAYALPHGLAAWLYWIHRDLHEYLVAHRFDTATYAIYAVGCLQLPLLGILRESVGSVAIPRVSQLQSEGRSHDILALTAGIMRKLAAVYFPLCAILLVVRSELITLFFTDAYLASTSIFAMNLALVPLATVSGAVDPVIRAYAPCRFFLLKLRLALVGLTLTGLYFGMTHFGLLGAVAVVVVISLLENFALAVKVSRILGMRRRDLALFKDLPRLAFAAAVAAAGAAIARDLLLGTGPLAVLFGCGLAFSATYLALVLACRVPRAEERVAVLRTVSWLHSRLVRMATVA